MRIKQIKAQQILEWQKRPMTEEEANTLHIHLNILYDAMRQAELMLGQVIRGMLGQVVRGMETYERIVNPLLKTQEETNEEGKLPPRKK